MTKIQLADLVRIVVEDEQKRQDSSDIMNYTEITERRACDTLALVIAIATYLALN